MNKLIATACVAALAVAASPASATIMLATVQGTVVNSPNTWGINAVDFAGDFGAPGSLDGKAFRLDITFDSERGDEHSQGALTDQIYGGAYGYSPGAGPVLSYSLTINNITQNFNANDFYSYARVSIDGSFAMDLYEDFEAVTGDHSYFYVNSGGTASNELSNPYSYNGPTCTECGRFFLKNDSGVRTSQGSYSVATIQVGAAVPEPATWALMILGFGTAGAMLRRRRATA